MPNQDLFTVVGSLDTTSEGVFDSCAATATSHQVSWSLSGVTNLTWQVQWRHRGWYDAGHNQTRLDYKGGSSLRIWLVVFTINGSYEPTMISRKLAIIIDNCPMGVQPEAVQLGLSLNKAWRGHRPSCWHEGFDSSVGWYAIFIRSYWYIHNH